MGTKTKGENGLGAAKYRDAGKRGGRKGNCPPPPFLSISYPYSNQGADYFHHTTTCPSDCLEGAAALKYIQQKRGMHRTVWSCTMGRIISQEVFLLAYNDRTYLKGRIIS